MAHQTAVDRGARGRDLELASQFVQDGAGAPAGMAPTQRDDAGLDLGRHLLGAAIGPGALVGEGGQALGGEAYEPPVKRPAVDPVVDRGVLHGRPVEHLPHGVVALLNHRKIHEWHGVLLGSVEHK
jgi:hypothetical protein